MNTCATCKHWEVEWLIKGNPVQNVIGHCLLTGNVDGGNEKAWAEPKDQENDTLCWLITQLDFGCNQHEPKTE